MLLTLETPTDLELNSTGPSMTVQFTAADNILCSGDHHYRLSYSYSGPDAYNVIGDQRASVVIQVTDGKYNHFQSLSEKQVPTKICPNLHTS